MNHIIYRSYYKNTMQYHNIYHYKCTVSYDGSTFNGWQKQGNTCNTIQQILEDQLSNQLSEVIEIRGAGRTDAGVHAIGQVFDFYSRTDINIHAFAETINPKLPETIRILTIEIVSKDFHARKSATGKIYEYRIDTRFVPNVFTRKYSYWLDNSQLNTKEMQKACDFLRGTYDYSSFTSDKTPDKSHIRTITSITLTCKDDQIILSFTGDGFLYNMVRILAGTLIEVGLGKIPANSIPSIINAKDRTQAGFTAPAHGLFLKEIYY